MIIRVKSEQQRHYDIDGTMLTVPIGTIVLNANEVNRPKRAWAIDLLNERGVLVAENLIWFAAHARNELTPKERSTIQALAVRALSPNPDAPWHAVPWGNNVWSVSFSTIDQL